MAKTVADVLKLVKENEVKFVDRPLALYYLAAAQRGLGQKELAEAAARPNATSGARHRPPEGGPGDEEGYRGDRRERAQCERAAAGHRLSRSSRRQRAPSSSRRSRG